MGNQWMPYISHGDVGGGHGIPPGACLEGFRVEDRM